MTTKEAIAGLLNAIAEPLNRNDLGRLAQMHSWGQALGDDEALPPGPAGAVLKRLALTLVSLLERLILDEAADPDTGLTLVPEAVHQLEAAHNGQTVNADDLIARITAAAGGPAPAPAAKAAPAARSATRAPEPSPPAAPPTKPAAAAPPKTTPAPAPAAPANTADEPYVSEPLLIDLSEREHLDGFLEEAGEHMDNIETGLLEVEANPSDADRLNELFRPFHTIKGIAGFLNLRDINRLTHEIETILDLGRKGSLAVTAGTVDLFFAAVDMLKAQLGAIRQYLAAPTGGPCPQPDIVAIMAKLRRAASGQLPDAGAERPRSTEASGTAPDDQDRTLPSQSAPTAADTVKAQPDVSIRVDTTKLDALVDAVGELVIAQSMVGLNEKVHEDEKLTRNVSQVSKIVRDVQETAMSMRMVPIGQTFQKMRRLVRDVSRKAGKLVELVINGEETELDKNVIQQMSDPLVHLVRNAIDHGIERPEVRMQTGKSETGQVRLNAYHQGDSIVIEIADDGRGLDYDKILAKAIEKGLAHPEDQLSEQQVFALILQPGFSTAEVVTDISGRGVGMDVVKRNVEQLRGKIDIHSEPGRGSTFLIRLPLTLAIIDGMIMRVGEERVIMPTILIEQSLKPEPQQITTVQRRGQMIQVRGELCPLIQLPPLFNYGPAVDPCENLVVVIQAEGQKVALVVEELIGQQQVVIKTLGDRFKKIRGVSGAAILGDGRVGLILEPSGLLALHNSTHAACYTAPVSKPLAAVVGGAVDTAGPTAPVADADPHAPPGEENDPDDAPVALAVEAS